MNDLTLTMIMIIKSLLLFIFICEVDITYCLLQMKYNGIIFYTPAFDYHSIYTGLGAVSILIYDVQWALQLYNINLLSRETHTIPES